MKLTRYSAGSRDDKVARALAAMANADEFAPGYAVTLTPRGYRFKDDAGRVWYAFNATPEYAVSPVTGEPATPWVYYLRRDYGSYAGSYLD